MPTLRSLSTSSPGSALTARCRTLAIAPPGWLRRVLPGEEAEAQSGNLSMVVADAQHEVRLSVRSMPACSPWANPCSWASRSRVAACSDLLMAGRTGATDAAWPTQSDRPREAHADGPTSSWTTALGHSLAARASGNEALSSSLRAIVTTSRCADLAQPDGAEHFHLFLHQIDGALGHVAEHALPNRFTAPFRAIVSVFLSARETISRMVSSMFTRSSKTNIRLRIAVAVSGATALLLQHGPAHASIEKLAPATARTPPRCSRLGPPSPRARAR